MMKTSNRKRVLVLAGDVWACGMERIVRPYTKLAGKDNNGIDFSIWDLKKRDKITDLELSMFDAVLFQRPCFDEHAPVMRTLKSRGVKVVIEVDDRLDCVSQTNPAYQVFHPGSKFLKNFYDCLAVADGLMTSTPQISDAYRLKIKSRKVDHFYNAIDLDDPIYQTQKHRENYPKDQINIMWSGSSSHWDSLQEVKSAIEQVIPRYSNARFVLGGNKQFMDMFNIPDEQKIFLEGVPVEEYTMFPSHADIFITPVACSPFNDGKSELKILEAGIFGVPSISSPAEPYKRFNELSNGGNIIVKGNRCDRWQKALKNLIEDEDLRKEKSDLTLKAINDHYNIDTVNEKRIAFWNDILA